MGPVEPLCSAFGTGAAVSLKDVAEWTAEQIRRG
jgi:hypothetical protein